MSRNPKERMFIVQISLLIIIFSSLISQILSLMQTTQEVNPHPRIAPCVDMWSAIFFFLCHLMNVGAPHHTIKMLHFVLFYSVTCHTNSIVSPIHVNTTKLHIIMCTLVATCVIPWRLEFIPINFTIRTTDKIFGVIGAWVSSIHAFMTCVDGKF